MERVNSIVVNPEKCHGNDGVMSNGMTTLVSYEHVHCNTGVMNVNRGESRTMPCQKS